MPSPSVEPTVLPPTPAPSAGTPTTQAHGNSAAVKIILIVLAVIMFVMLLAAGSCFYVAYRVKKKAHEFSQEMGGDAVPYTGKKDPCLLSAADVGAILGEPVEPAQPRGTMACEYRYGRANQRSLEIDFTWKGGGMMLKLALAGIKHVAGMDTFTAVPGIGDETYIAPGGSGLMMRKGDVLVNIDLRVAGVNLDAAEKIAAKIANRL